MTDANPDRMGRGLGGYGVPGRLIAIAGAARAFMEPVWADWHRDGGGNCPPIPSQSTCGRTALFLQRALVEDGFCAHWANGIPRASEEGPQLGPFGFFDGASWRSHCWVKAEGWIVDITADQFGAAPVIVVPVTDPRYGERTFDAASPEHISRRIRQVDGLWPLWLAARACLGNTNSVARQ